MNLFSIGGFFWETINGLGLVLCDLIYRIIGYMYQVFDAVAKVNLFSEDIFEKFTSRMYIVMGIAMLFIFAYNIILMIINPDKPKSKGKPIDLLKNTLISFTLIVFMPLIFRYMTVLQNDILDSEIIGKIILAADTGTASGANDYDNHCNFSSYGLEKYSEKKRWYHLGDPSKDVSDVLSDLCNKYKDLSDSVKGAYSIAPILMQTFYRTNHFTYDECQSYLQGDTSLITDAEDQKICINYFFDVNAARYTGNVSHFVGDSYLKNIVSDEQKDHLTLDWFWGILAGLLAAWMFICYTMSIGVRVAKLGVLQLVSPIPIMLRVLPEDKTFKTWFEHLKSTYIDVFIRLAIIYFALFAISLVPEVIGNLFASLWIGGTGDIFVKLLATVIVILGILKFAQEVPDLMKDFFKGGGNFALKSPKKQFNENKIAKGTLGAGGAFMATGAKSAMNAWGAGRNFVNNFKNAEGFKNKAKVLGKGAWGGFTGAGRFVGQAAGSLKGGYEYGQEAKDWGEIRSGAYRASAEQLTKPTLKQKADSLFHSEVDPMLNFYKSDFKAVDSKRLLQEAEAFDKVSDALKKFEDKLDSSDAVKSVVDAINSLKTRIDNGQEVRIDGETFTAADYKDPTRLREIMEKLKSYEKKEVGAARQRAYKKAYDEGDIGTTSLAENYRTAVKDNITALNAKLKEKGKDTIDINIDISDAALKGEVESVDWKKSRAAGKAAGDIATNNRSQALEQKKKVEGK